MKVYTLRVVCGVQFFHIVMPLPSNSVRSGIIIDSASENFLIFTQNLDPCHKKILNLSLRYQNFKPYLSKKDGPSPTISRKSQEG